MKTTLLLALLCIAAAVTGFAWTAWDMFGVARRPMLQGWDDSYYYFWLPSVVIDHDLDFSNQLAQSGTIDPATRDTALSLPKTATGLVANKYPPGWAIGSLPFFLVARGFAPPRSTGFEPIYLVSVWLGQLAYAITGLWFAARIVARFFPRELAWPVVLAGWLASPLLYYQTARLSMSHSQVFALAALVFWLALRILDGESRAVAWATLGFACALLVVTRNLCVVYLALPAWVLIQRLRSVRAAAWILLGAALPLGAQLLAWKILYGSWFAYSYGGERFDFSHLHLAGVLFSPRHGWFYWHPLMLVGTAAFAAWGARRNEARAWLLSLLAVILLNAAWPTWWLGSSFGYRGFEVPTLFAMLGLAALFQTLRNRSALRNALVTLVGAAVAWNLLLFALFLTQRIPREASVTYGHMIAALGRWAGVGH